jgi:mannose-6-phosphate isomerase-like protein (cupin superfamily)
VTAAPRAAALCPHRASRRSGLRDRTFDPAPSTRGGATIDSMTTNVGATGTGATLVDASAIEERPWHDLAGFENVRYKQLWQSGKSVAGIMYVAPAGRVDPHVHRRSHHHIWVLEGSAEMLGQQVGPGSYLHVPAGVEHGITAPGSEGCTMFYLYLRDDTSATPPQSQQ